MRDTFWGRWGESTSSLRQAESSLNSERQAESGQNSKMEAQNALKEELATMDMIHTTIDENMRGLQVDARTYFGNMVTWVSAQNILLDKIGKAIGDVKGAKDILDKAASTRLAALGTALKEHEMPETSDFTVQLIRNQTPASAEQALSRSFSRSLSQDSAKTADSVQEIRNEKLGKENIAAMRDGFTENMETIRENGKKVDKDLVKAALFKSELAYEPEQHWKNVQTIYTIVDIDRSFLDRAEKAALVRTVEQKIIEKGRAFVDEAYKKLSSADLQVIRNVKNTSESIEKKLEEIENVMKDKSETAKIETLTRDLHNLLDQHKGHTDAFMQELAKRLTIELHNYTEKEENTIKVKTDKLGDTAYAANTGFGAFFTLAVTNAAPKVLDVLAQAAAKAF